MYPYAADSIAGEGWAIRSSTYFDSPFFGRPPRRHHKPLATTI
jgi:hypothetical protein